MKEIKTLKYPLRFLSQLLLIALIILFANGIITKQKLWDDPNNYYILYLFAICFIELFAIIYLLRNKTYFAVDKSGNKYMIKKSKLTSKETKQSSEELIVDHYFYGSKTMDAFNLIDLLLSLPTKKEIQKAIKKKVLSFPKYQIENITKKFSILGMKYYKINFKDGKKKYLLVFNKL